MALGPTKRPFQGYWSSLPGGKAARGVRLTSSAEVKNERSYASILSVCLRGMYRNDLTHPLTLNSGNLKTDMFKNVFAFF